MIDNDYEKYHTYPLVAESHPVGFYLTTPSGHVAHVLGSKNMSEKTIEALQSVIDLLYRTPVPELKKWIDKNNEAI